MATNKFAKIVQADLEPYYNISAPKLKFSTSIKSSYEYDIDSIVQIIDDKNTVKSILQLLTTRTQRILSSLYSYDIIAQFPAILKKFYGKRVGPVLFSADDLGMKLEDLVSLCNIREISELKKEEYLKVFTIGKNATILYNQTINAYIFAKQTIINRR